MDSAIVIGAGVGGMSASIQLLAQGMSVKTLDRGPRAGGKLRTYQRTTRVAAKPAEIPVKLTVDVSPLDSGDTLRMRDLSLDNARLLDHPNVVLAHVDPPRAAKKEDDKKGKKK